MQRYDSYKDSGIQWLGQIPGHWEIKKLKVFCKENKQKNKGNVETTVLSLSYGHIKIKEDLNFGLIPENYESYQIVFPGDVVLRLTDLQNDHRSLRTGLVKDKGIITSAYVGLKISQANSAYIQLLLHTYDIFKLFYSMGGGLRQSMSYLDVSNLLIPIPPLAEQKAIVTYLDGETEKIDSFISSKEKEIRLLDELKQAEIANAVTRGLHPNVPMKDSGISWLGQVPRHWEIKRLSTQFIGKVEANSDYQYKRAFKFNYGSLVPKEETGTEEEYRDTYIKYSVLNKGDIVINGLNLNYDFVSQRVALCEKDGIITSAYVVCRPRQDVFSEYFCYLFKGMDAQKLFHGMGTGIRLTLSFEELKKQMLPVPPLDEQHEIVDYINHRCETINTLTTELESEITQLKEYKQRLIADAVTGQIKVC